MVIGPGKNGISAFVILGDGELLPARLNSPKVLVFRQGNSTGRQLEIVKALGALAGPELLYVPPKSVAIECPGLTQENDPVHEHEAGEWYFYESTWTLEHGPYQTKEECLFAFEVYKETERKDLTASDELDRLAHAKPRTEN